jgi:hypothetical protein
MKDFWIGLGFKKMQTKLNPKTYLKKIDNNMKYKTCKKNILHWRI